MEQELVRAAGPEAGHFAAQGLPLEPQELWFEAEFVPAVVLLEAAGSASAVVLLEAYSAALEPRSG